MSLEQLETAECPFTAQGEELVNVKFFRGRRDDIITREEIRAQFRSAKMQHRQQIATVSKDAPVSDHPVMDVRELVRVL